MFNRGRLEQSVDKIRSKQMSRTDLIVDIIRAGAAGDGDMLRATVEALAAEERAKKNGTLASKFTRALEANGHTKAVRRVASLPSPGRELVAEAEARLTLESLVLTPTSRLGIEQLVDEHHRADLLRSHGLQPRHRLLLSGPPGNGKTALAEAIAEAVGVPFYTVRYETLIGSFLGETAQRLGQLFAFARTTPCVLFFDEFDVVGKERGDAHETGEIKRVVSNLLLQIDDLPSHVIAVAASNHAELLDRAVWRRFQLRLSMPSPSSEDLAMYFARAFVAAGEPDVDPYTVVERIGLVSYAEAREFLMDIRRRHVLSLGQMNYKEIVSDQLAQWAERAKPIEHGNRSNKTSTKARSTGIGKKEAGTSKKDPAARGISTPKTKRPARAKVSTPSRGSRSRPRTGSSKS